MAHGVSTVPRQAIKAYEFGFLQAGWSIPGRPHPAATQLVIIIIIIIDSIRSTPLTYVDDDVVYHVITTGQSDVVSPGFHDDAINIILILAVSFTPVLSWCQVRSVVFLDPASSVGEPRWYLGQRHLRDNRQHDLLGFGWIRILNVLIQPGLQHPRWLATGALTAYIQRSVPATQSVVG